MRTLLIEDEPGIADFVQRALRAQGHVVDIASDGLEGERQALITDVDLAILDRRLPGRDGIGVLRGLRAGTSHEPSRQIGNRGRRQVSRRPELSKTRQEVDG